MVGASNIVGKPMALMLMQKDATVCICHAKTRDLAQFTILADILVVAAGRPNLIVPQMVKTGAVVVDVVSIDCRAACWLVMWILKAFPKRRLTSPRCREVSAP